MYSLFWVEIYLVDTKLSTKLLEHIPQCFPRKIENNFTSEKYFQMGIISDFFGDIAHQI